MNEKSPSGHRYDREFKENAVALVRAGRGVSSVARDLGVRTWSLGRWVQAANGGHSPHEPHTLAAESPEARELRRLRQENACLREQRDILRKALGILSAEMPPRVTRSLETMKTGHSINAMAETREVSRSGFFAHQHKGEAPRRQQDRALVAAIEPIFLESRRTCGSPRVTAALRQGGRRCGKNRVARLMRGQGLRAPGKSAGTGGH